MFSASDFVLCVQRSLNIVGAVKSFRGERFVQMGSNRSPKIMFLRLIFIERSHKKYSNKCTASYIVEDVGVWLLIPYKNDVMNNSDVLFQRIGYHIYTYKSFIIPHLLKE